ncbi:MAG: hypothetical protein BWY28_01855 [bacterium ADurb.Bin236]|nr:MAG: hypothetical protein BWY28_01855 [bacterium ADurb.Bin236]HPN93905.1 hypothetical protein [bacterium]
MKAGFGKTAKWFFALVVALAAARALSPATALAAVFELEIAGGAAVRVGEVAYLKITMEQGTDPAVGAQCSLSADPAMIEFLPDRNLYAADALFSMVEKFKVSPETGTVVFHARANEPPGGRVVFLKAPFRMKRPGATFVSFSSTALFGEEEKRASNPGYVRLLGYEGESADPLLYATLAGDNALLRTGARESMFETSAAGPRGSSLDQELALMDMGMRALDKAQDEKSADVVIGFSKRQVRIGVNQWTRLDIVIDKFPEYETMTGIEVTIKYDPRYLMLTDRLGRETTSVEVLEPLDDMTRAQLLKMMEEMGLAAPPDAEADTLRSIIDGARRWDYRSIFTLPFSNRVDKSKGEIKLALLANLTAAAGETKAPMTVATLLFKGLRSGQNIPVEMIDAMVPVSKGTQHVRNALITIDSSQKGCDESLPPSLCSGTFKITGNMQLTLDRASIDRKSLVGSSKEDHTTVDTKVEKLNLQQAWNVYLDGSFRNGMTVNGNMSDSPGQPEQHLDVEVASKYGTVRFGDFNTNFESGTMVSMDRQKINGMQFDYKSGGVEFAALLAESRSSTKFSALPDGQNITGPYKFNAGMIIPGTIHIFKSDGTEIAATQYTVNYRTGEIYFVEPVPSGEKRSISYEETSFLFSTGNLRAYRMSYKKTDAAGRNDKFKVGAVYRVASAPKSTSVILDGEELVDVSHSSIEQVPCPYNTSKTCAVVNLTQAYILKGSVTVTHGGKAYNPSVSGGPVYAGHRSYLHGRFHVERGVTGTGIYGQISIKYSYYNPEQISSQGYMVYRIPDNGFDTADSSTMGTYWSWPSNAFPGSETVLLSDTDSYEEKWDDVAICNGLTQAVTGGGTTIVRSDNTTFCPGDYDKTLDNMSVFYQFYDAGTDSFLKFSNWVNLPNTDPRYKEYRYLKIRYFTTPMESSVGSEFEKTALGLTASANLGRRLTVEGEYALTNSDLAASYGSGEETVTIDADSYTLGGKETGSLCVYDGTNAADRTLTCNLPNGNIVGSVKVMVRHCERVDANPINSCLCDKEGLDPGNDCYDPLTGTNKIKYQAETFEISRLYVREERADGRVVLVRRAVGLLPGGFTYDLGFADSGHYFPRKFDQLEVSYIYNRVLGSIVEGSKHSLRANYNGKLVKVSLTKGFTDPFFDTSVGGSKSALANTDSTLLTLNTTVKKWQLTFTRNETETGSINASTLEPSSLSSSVTKGVDASFTGRKHIRGFTIKTSIVDRMNASSMGTASETVAETTENSTSVAMTNSFMKDLLAITSGLSLLDKKNADKSDLDTSAIGKSLNINFKPRRNIGLILDFKDNRTRSEQASVKDVVGRTNNYTLNYRPLELMDINATLARSASGSAGKTTVQETSNYNFKVLKDWRRFSGVNLTFSKTRTPSETYSSSSDSRNLTMNIRLPWKMTLIPTFTRNVSGSGTGWNKSDTRNLRLTYAPTKGKIKSASWINNNQSSERPATTTSAETKTRTATDTLAMTVAPSSKGTVAVSYNRTPASYNHKFSMTGNYLWRNNINVGFNVSQDHKGGTIPSRTTSLGLNTSYQLNALTSFSLTFKRDLVKSETPGTKSTTNLRATLNTRFD